ncbi:MAG: putative bifunctional diguanylate cyclase/phosphodiesterase [Geminicoccaceae bacterium]
MLIGGPLAMAVLAVGQAATLGSGWLSSGSDVADALLLGFSLLVVVVSALMGGWQHRAIVRPLQELARSAAAGTCAAAVGGGAVAREIALLGQRLVPDSATPERDPLTGLLSAAGLHATATPDLESEHAGGGRWLLIVADIDRLRDVNGLHGFGFGDEVLRQFARRLRSMCVAPAVAARVGGDRFALLMPASAGEGGNLPAMVTESLGRPFRIAGCELNLVVHAGAALFPDHGNSFQRLMRAAELALENARRGKGARATMFDPQTNRAAAARRTLEKELRRAIEREELVLYYQPQVDLVAGQVIAVEALVRWRHPDKGLIPPQSFIPAAEASGLIRPIGAWVLAEACRATRRWHDQGIDVGISVNVSAAQLRHQDLAATVAQALLSTGLPPGQLELELTESMFVDPTQLTVHRAVQAIAAMGVRLAIDDFGTGYSSLGYLKRLPVHKIKIDKSFVRELGRDAADAAIVRSIIGLAMTFGKRVLAEGVEEASQYRFLLAEGCHEAQGYYFARPLPEHACGDFLLQHGSVAASGSLLERQAG